MAAPLSRVAAPQRYTRPSSMTRRGTARSRGLPLTPQQGLETGAYLSTSPRRRPVTAHACTPPNGISRERDRRVLIPPRTWLARANPVCEVGGSPNVRGGVWRHAPVARRPTPAVALDGEVVRTRSSVAGPFTLTRTVPAAELRPGHRCTARRPGDDRLVLVGRFLSVRRAVHDGPHRRAPGAALRLAPRIARPILRHKLTTICVLS